MKKLFLLSYLCFSWILKVLLSRLLFLSFFMIVGVIAQVLKEIVSTQKFLFGVKTLPHYDELQRKQLERLKPIVQKHVISVEMAGRIMESFSDVWSVGILDELKALVAEQSESQEDLASRAGLQDFTALPNFIQGMVTIRISCRWSL